MSAKLSLGDIMAREMHASDVQLWISVEIDRNNIKYVLDLLNNILIMHMRGMESVILHGFDVINDDALELPCLFIV